jgi:hypothetical protein
LGHAIGRAGLIRVETNTNALKEGVTFNTANHQDNNNILMSAEALDRRYDAQHLSNGRVNR